MNPNALMIGGWLVLLAGVIVRIAGDKTAGAAILLAAVAVLIASRFGGGSRRR